MTSRTLFLALTLVSSNLHAASTWLSEQMGAVNSAEHSRSEELFETLAPKLNLGKHAMTAERKMVFDHVQAILLSKPGHATHFAKRMRTLNEAMDNESDPARKKAIFYNQSSDAYAGTTALGFSHADALEGLRYLRFLPSPESVSALASFLEDRRGRDGLDYFGEPWKAPEASHGIAIDASVILAEIGIESPPVRLPMQREGIWEQVDAWAEWWNEVKSGKRTYRFEGSPIEYGPDGPVDPSTLKHRDRRQPAASTSPLPKSSPPEVGLTSPASESKPSRTFLAITLAAIALLLTGAYRAFLRRKTAPTR